MPGVRREVERGGAGIEPGEEILERELRSAVLAHHHRRDPLAHRRQRVAMLFQLVVGVAVGVDEAGGEGETGAVDEPVVAFGLHVAHRDDAVAHDTDRRDCGRGHRIRHRG